jgi:Putative prokaryotic signal transducing protein
VSEYVTVQEADNDAMADLIKQRLAEAGIACVVVPGDLAALVGAGASYALTVPAEKADEARELLRE